MNYKLYGIKNCDTVKKARKELESIGIDYEMVDFKKDPPSVAKIRTWTEFYGSIPVNKRGTTYRKFKDTFEGLPAEQQLEMLAEWSSAIKRPILEKNDNVIALGFKVGDYLNLK